METKYSKFIRIGFLGGLLMVLFGYYFVTFQIIESKKELKEIEASKEKAKQEMLLYQSKTKILTNVIQQTGDTVAIKKAVAIVNNNAIVKAEPALQNPSKVVINPAVNQSSYKEALNLEAKGYDALFSKDVDKSIEAFKKSENTYNGFHMSNEITHYLKLNKDSLRNPNSESWKEAYSKIAKDYSWKMSKDVKSQLIQESKK